MMEREVKKYCLQNKQLLGKINGSLGDQMRAVKACDKVCVGVVPTPWVKVPLPWKYSFFGPTFQAEFLEALF